MYGIKKSVINVMALLIIIVAILPGSTVTSDKGGISITHIDIPLYEPGQKAIICWDGAEELLILSTDVKASQTTKVLEIMPLPAEPEIFTCNYTIFESVKKLVEWQEAQDKSVSGGLGDGDTSSEKPPEIDIIFHKSLGIHNLTVIKAYTATGFANWTSEFIRSVGLTPMTYPKAEKLAEAYISRDIQYFVLDIIELTPELSSPEPLIYKFKSNSVYYPMEITSLTGGESQILLFILTPYEQVKGSYDKKEDSFLSEKTTTWQDEKFIELEPPNSPVSFKKITSTNVNTRVFQDHGVETYDGFYADPDIHYIKDFFRAQKRIKISVYEYDGPVEMSGDISVKTYSIESVKIDEESQ
ncbi:MAG: DUF2330 domain-containing protein, partial [Thermoplasmata archaeon]|nr:DUF2330 domain-containing protein [Thermoplasmata archaeon]